MTLSRETLVYLNHQLAGFSLPGIRSNSDAPGGNVRQAIKALAGLNKELAAASRSISLRGLGRALADFSLLPLPNPLLEIKRAANGTQIKGYASTFGALDMQDEIVDSGAFGVSLAAHRRAGTQPKMLWQHDTHEICGLWTNLTEDSTGLMAQGLLLDSVQRGKEAIALLDAGAELGCSIGFRAVRDRVVNKVRHLQEVDLLEISLVTFPASPGTRIRLAAKEYGNRSAAKVLGDLERALSDFSLARFR